MCYALICVTHLLCGSALHICHFGLCDVRCLSDAVTKPSSLQVEEVDEGLLQLQRLEELTLCANQISRITSANLPRTLKVSKQCLVMMGWGKGSHLGMPRKLSSSRQLVAKGVSCSIYPGQVLELCCNAVADLKGLCAQPPPELQHLGLGYNRLHGPLQDKHLTADFW